MEDDYKYIRNYILEVEKNYPVIDWEVDGIQIWPIIRVNSRIIRREDSLDKVNESTDLEKKDNCVGALIKKINGLIYYGKLFFKDRLRDRKHNDCINQPRDIVFLSQSESRKAKVNGQYYFTEFFPFLSYFNDVSFLILEFSYANTYKLPRFNKSVILKREMAGYLLREKLIKRLKRSSKTNIINCPFFDEVVCFLKKRDIEIFSENELKHIAETVRLYEKYFIGILKKIKPKLVVVEPYYALECFSLILAAKRLGIATADLQHGLQGDEHIAYGHWPPCSKGYMMLPEYFLVWGKQEKATIEKWGGDCGNKHKVLITGHPWLTLWKEKPLPFDFKNQLDNLIKFKKANSEKHILFTMDDKNFPKDIIKLIKESPTAWQWWIRMHPIVSHKWDEYSKIFTECFRGCNVNWIEASLCPLPALFSFIDLHITYESTVAIECAEWGIPSIVGKGDWFKTTECKLYIKVIELDKITLTDIHNVMNETIRNDICRDKNQLDIKFIVDNILG